MKFLKRKKLSQNNTKILTKNTHCSVETQPFGKFTNTGQYVIEKQNKKKFKRKFFVKSFSSSPQLCVLPYFAIIDPFPNT